MSIPVSVWFWFTVRLALFFVELSVLIGRFLPAVTGQHQFYFYVRALDSISRFFFLFFANELELSCVRYRPSRKSTGCKKPGIETIEERKK